MISQVGPRWTMLTSGLLGLLVITGCAKPAAPGEPEPPSTPLAVIPGPGTAPTVTPPAEANPVASLPPLTYDQSFADATVTELYDGAKPPPGVTVNGLPIPKLQSDVRALWPSIQYTMIEGRPAAVIVQMETDAGLIEITLFPDIAPNHVRNFLALVQLGYYNGLSFERVVRFDYVADDKTMRKLELLTAGCPVGDGESEHSHLGYFLKSERQSLLHEEGVVGFVRDDEPNSASCRLYFAVTAAPMMDGHYIAFGRITGGMEVLKALATKPVKNPATYPDNEQLQQPLKIQRIIRK